MNNRILVCFVLSAGILPLLVNSVGTDMGTCACLCGLETEGGVISPDGGGATSVNSFAARVRGATGDRGLTGKQGSKGPRGRPGIRGPRGPQGVSGGSGNNDAMSSCFDLRVGGHTQSGIYKIKPSDYSSTIQVYCDMEINGGGWTLVGSVHENNILGKCSLGDNWSDDQGSDGKSSSSSWSNTRTFGSVESATSDDYKNSAYFSLPASDVMVWHVPNNNPPSQWANRATLRYFTDNRFLTQYGSNLRDMFVKYFPMERVTDEAGTYEGISTIVNRLNTTSVDIRNAIPGFHRYEYDGGSRSAISDGGNDMYDTGNRVSVRAGAGDWRAVVYGEVYQDMNTGFEVASTVGHPFIALMYIGNRGGNVPTFDLKVESGTGADGSGSTGSYEGDLVNGDFNMRFKTYNVYGANDPSICEVYFFVWSSESWNSVVSDGPGVFRPVDWSSGTDNLVNSVRVSGNPQNAILGYTLFSKSDDTVPTEAQVTAALRIMLQTMSEFNSIEGFNCSRLAESAVAPVRFYSGAPQDVANSVPQSQRAETTPGFLQFRALNPKGVPFAMCPGVKTESCRPSSVCIGGINTMTDEPTTCGDFTGYGGIHGNIPTETEPDGSARSLNDLKTSILIFTRDSDTSSIDSSPLTTQAPVKKAAKKGT